jgi:hypothetical protein
MTNPGLLLGKVVLKSAQRTPIYPIIGVGTHEAVRAARPGDKI